jgi:glycosyltransferase involved in cell wall biosynthesis
VPLTRQTPDRDNLVSAESLISSSPLGELSRSTPATATTATVTYTGRPRGGSGSCPPTSRPTASSGPEGSSAFVAISESDRSPELEYAATIHHGIDLDGLPFQSTPGDHPLSFGRIHPDKGTADAIEIARRAGRRLVICGIVQDEQYFADQAAPHIDGRRVVFLGAVDAVRRADILGAAAALLHPIHFEEPFGLSVVEAMACGTPVVAYDRGSMREVLDEGVTGCLARDIESAVIAVGQVLSLDRAAVHSRAVQRFGVNRMVDDYLKCYESLVGSASQSSRKT